MLPPDGAKRVRNLFAEGMIRRTGDGIYHYRSYPIDLSIDKIQDKKNGLQANVHFEWNLRIQCEERLYIDREKERASYSKKLAKRITDGSANHQGKPVGELIAKTLADAVEALRAKREEERKEALERRLELKQSGETVNALGREFVIRDNRIYLLKPVKEDESIEIEVSNCYLDLKRQETLDDGRERTLLYVADIVRGEHRTEIEFPHKDLCTAKLKEHLGARPDVYFEPLGHLQAVVAKRAETNPPEVVTINQKFGYQTDGCFVSPSVIIEPNGLILKNEDRPLRLDRIEHAAYLDILPMEDEDKLKALMGHILSDFLYVNDPLISGALLGHVGLAVCRRFLRLGGPFVLWVHGTTGLGKSMLAKAAQNFFGDFDTHRRCDGAATYQTWRSTPYQIEKIGYYFSDAIYLIDDFKRSNFRNESDYRAALGTIQNYADGTGRGRLRKNAGADKKTTPIRGEAVVTGEQLPEGEASSIARLLPVAVEHFGDIDRGKRTLAECHRYSAVTAALIVSGMKRNHEALQRRYDEHQQFFQKGVQGKDNYIRIAETLAASLLGFEVFMGLMMEKEVITEEQREKLTAEQRDSLRRVRSELIREVASQRASTRWLERFNQLLSTRRIRIGQEVNQAYAAMGDVDQYIPEVGFVKATQPHLVYVLADLAVSEVRKHFPDHEISTTRQAIAKQLEADKVLIRQGERLTDKVRRAGPYVPGCWAIMRDQLTLPDSTGNNVSVMEQQAEVEKSFLMLKRHAAAKVTPYVEKAVEKARESFQSLENLTSALEKQHDYVALNLDFDQRVRRLLESAEGSDKEAVQAAQRQAVQALRAANSCISSEYVSSSAPASAEKIDGNNY